MESFYYIQYVINTVGHAGTERQIRQAAISSCKPPPIRAKSI